MHRVIVVDDDPVARALTATTLHEAGFAVLEAADGTSGLALVRTHPAALVVLDLGLPDLDGLDVLGHIRGDRRTAGVPVILLTGGGPGREVTTGLDAGADDYLTKPFDGAELCARVRAHLRSRQRSGDPANPARVTGIRSTLTLEWARAALRPVFQPVVDLATREVVGHEALARFADGSPPVEVFEAGHERGIGADLELLAVERALEAAAGLPDERWVSINVSPRVVLDRPELAARLDAAERPVVVELTEHEPVHDYPRLVAALEALGPNVSVAIDDAGAGYASLSHVVAVRPDFVKLDRGWIADLDLDPVRRPLVGGMVEFAQQSGSTLIAEGVETPGELAQLRALGVELAQGYLLGRPAPATAGGRSTG